jgi:anti-sigma B factor antagonist
MVATPTTGGGGRQAGPPSFTLSTGTNGRDTLLQVAGDLDISSAPALRSALQHALRDHPRRLFVSLQDVSFIDSSGVSVLVGAWRRVSAQGGELVLWAPRPAVHRVLDLAGFSRIVSFCQR